METDEEKSDFMASLNEMKQIRRLSGVSPFMRSFSWNSSGDPASAVKRKLIDSDVAETKKIKESHLGSPLMSPWEFKKIRGELIDAQAKIVRLEDRIDQLHKKNKESVIFFDQEKSELKNDLESKTRTIQSLEHKVQQMRTREAEALDQLNDFKKTVSFTRIDRDERLLFLENENEELRMRIDELSGEEDGELREMKEEIENLRAEVARYQLNDDENEALMESMNARLAVALEDCRDMEELKLQLETVKNQVKEVERERDELEEGRTLSTVLQDRVLRLSEIEAQLKGKNTEIENLKLAVENKVLLEEKVYNLELKLSIASNVEAEYIALKEKNFDLEKELERWVELAVYLGDNGTREGLKDYVTDLREMQVAYTLERNTMKGEIESASGKLKTAMDELETAKAFEKELKETLEKHAVEVKLLRRKVALVARERDSYRQQLDMYEKDLTVCGKPAGFETAQQERVLQLEGTVQEYRDLLSSLENQLKVYQNDDAEARIEETRRLQEELKLTKEQLDRVSKRRNELEELLEGRARSGQCLTPQTKVVHFKNNPFAVADEKIREETEGLRRECETLKARVRLLEAGDRLNLTVKAAAEVESGQAVKIKELEEQLESAKLKNTRLKEVFKRTSQDFRDVSYMLLGYRIDLVSNKIYRLTNMYSEDPNHHLMFQLNRDGMMEMLETPFTEYLSELVNEHLHVNKSIPCFLSAVTLSLHETTDSAGEESPEECDDDEPEEVEISD